MGVAVNQIPNAPNAIPGAAPLPSTPIPPGAKMFNAPQINSPNFDRAQGVLSRTAQLLDAPTPQPVEFIDYAARAWADFGETGARVAANLMDFSVQMQRTKDEGNIAKIENMMASSYGDFVTWSQDKQPDEMLPEWNKRQAAMMKEFGKMNFSQNGMAKASVLVDNKMIQYGVDVATTARKRQIKYADDEIIAARDRALTMGDYETANAYEAKRHALGITSPGEMQQNQDRFAKQQQLDTLNRMIATDPMAAREKLQQAMQSETGRLEELPMLDNYTIQRGVESARARVVQNQREAITQISDFSLKNPNGINAEQIQQLGERAGIPQENIDALKNNWQVRYDETPEGQAIFTRRQNDLFLAVRRFKPELDPESGELTDRSFEEYRSLDMTIRKSMPPGYVERFTSVLERSMGAARKALNGEDIGDEQRTVENKLMDYLERMRKNDGLGEDGGTDENGKPYYGDKFLKVEQRQAEIANRIRGIFKRNPNISEEEAFNQFRQIFNNEYSDEASREFFKQEDKRPFWQRLFSAAVDGPMGDNPNVMAAGISWGSRSVTDGLDQDEPLPPIKPQFDENMPPGTIDGVYNRLTNPIAKDIAGRTAEISDIDPAIPVIIAQIESGMNSKTTNPRSSSKGLFQMLNMDRKRYGGDGIDQGIAKVEENYNAAKKALGREPSPAEVYVVYFQGIGAGPRILQNPQGDLRATLETIKPGWSSTVMKANPHLQKMRTNADLIAWAEKRVAQSAATLGI